MNLDIRPSIAKNTLPPAGNCNLVLNCLYLAVFSILLLLAPIAPSVADSKVPANINCQIQKGPCNQTIDGRKVTLEVLPRPVKAMQDLTFKVSTDGQVADGQQPFIKLNMPAMDMGKNRVPLKLNDNGVYQGRGVIVRCRSGKRTWKATVVFPGIGSADFIFDVIY